MEMRCEAFVIIMKLYISFLNVFFWMCSQRVIHLVSGLASPNNIRHMFGGWVYEMNWKERLIFLVGIGTILWSIWLRCIEVVFNKVLISSSMQVIFRGTYWTRTWVNFQKVQMKKTLQSTCRVIESLTMKIFAKHEWWSTNRLSFWWTSILHSINMLLAWLWLLHIRVTESRLCFSL
jgi:hypothetical protein